ncbi:cell division protein SepF [Streptomyces sp. NRRL F-4707]|nr:cell division protein SepF [Streptomyces sp. NRRL F-4711]KOX34654.1 cell division protein SepF [Streptomyces sp. NRRL F-4707]KOX46730.1 cell division protein SepF [Streptomyces sp. NRRL F-7442]NEB58139.1 cell division protein SepF [Streptomyces diastaticus]
MAGARNEGEWNRGEPVNSHDVTDEQWEGLAQVVPLRGRDAWPSSVGHRAMPEAETERRRRFVVLRVNVFADAREVAETLMSGIPVLLDLTSAEGEVAKRVLDFSTGVVFGLASGMHRVDRNVFLLTPAGTEVNGLMEGAVGVTGM